MIKGKNYQPGSLALPADGWKNLLKWAKKTHAFARSGKRYGKPSWRTSINYFSLRTIPILLAQGREAKLSHAEWQHVQLRIDIDATRAAAAAAREES